jgi:hypothetical protein
MATIPINPEGELAGNNADAPNQPPCIAHIQTYQSTAKVSEFAKQANITEVQDRLIPSRFFKRPYKEEGG